MSEYLSKKAVLEWLKKRLDETQFVREAYALAEIIAKIECGRFDDDQTEVQRLRDALDWVKRRFEEEWTYELGTGEVVEEIIVKFEEALSGAREKEEPNHDT